MKLYINIFIVFILMTQLNGKSLTSKYKQMMSDTSMKKETPHSARTDHLKNKQAYSLSDGIKRIKDLKQGTFESTSTFQIRRNKAITELENKIKFFAQNASAEYSAGRAKMKDYNADDEKMQLSLEWNNDLKPLFSETKNLQTVLLNISRNEAKELFSNKNTHFFHTDLGYENNKLSIMKMSLYDKYEFYKIATKKKKMGNVNITKPIKKTSLASKTIIKNLSTGYEINPSLFGMHGSYNGKAMFELSAQLDPESCLVNVNAKKLANLDFGSNCKFIISSQNEKLVCLKNMKRCIKHKDLRSIVFESLNEGNWYVSNVRSDDTLSVRNGPGMKYRKVFSLPYDANYLKVLSVQMNGKSSWYKITYNQIVGWVNSRFLNHKE